MADEFKIPLGIDSGNLESSLNSIISKLEQLNGTSEKVKKSLDNVSNSGVDKLESKIDGIGSSLDDASKKSDGLNTSFNKSISESTKQAEKLEKQLTGVSKGVESISKISKEFGNKLSSSFNEAEESARKAGTSFSDYAREKLRLAELSGENANLTKHEKEQLEQYLQVIDILQQKLNNISNLNLEGFATEAQLQELENSLMGVTDEFQELGILLEFVEQRFNEMSPDTEGYDELADSIQFMKLALGDIEFDKLESDLDSVGETSERVTQRMTNLKNQLYELAIAGERDTETYRDLVEELSNMQREIQRTNVEIESTASRTKHLDRMLLGVQGVVGGFATLQSIIALTGTETEEYEEITKQLVATLTLMQGIQANINFLNQIKQGQLGRINILEKISLTNAKQLVATYSAQAKAITLSTIATRGATLATKAFRVALASTGIGLVVVALGYLYENWDKVTKKINEFLPVGKSLSSIFDVIEANAMGVGKAVVNFVSAPIQGLIDLLSGESISTAFNNFKDNLNVIKNFNEGHQETIEKQTTEHLQKIEEEQIAFLNREAERMKNRYAGNEEKMKEAFIMEQQARLREIKLLEDRNEDASELRKQFEDETDKHYSNLDKQREQELENQKRAEERRIEQVKRNAERLRQERIKQAEENRKLIESQNNQLNELEKELEDLSISRIEDETERRIAELRTQAKRRIEAIENETALTEEAREKQAELIRGIEDKLSDEIEKIETDSINKRLEIRKKGYEQLLELAEKSEENEIAILRNNADKKIEEIKAQYANEIEIRNRLIELVNAETDRKESEIRQKYKNDSINEEEERLILLVELSSEYADKSVETERQKQIAILEIQKKYAEIRLNNLIDSGESENSIEVLKLKNLIKDLDDEIADVSSEGSFNLMNFLGLGKGLEEGEMEAIGNAMNTTMESISQMTSFMISQYDEQIKQRERNIRSIEKEISAIEGKYEKELELREEGLANNADAMASEIDALEEKKQMEIQLQQEAFEAKKKIQRQQLVADTIVQTTNLITSATEIFKSLAKLGPLGIGLAVTTIATMFGAFATAKVKAFQMVNSERETFADGGIIDGKPHSRGGEKYYSLSGNKIKEIEGGEFVVNKKQTQKYKDVLESINSGKFRFDIAELAKTNADSKEVQMMFNDNGYLERINKGIEKLNSKETIYETATHLVKTKGNTIRRIRK